MGSRQLVNTTLQPANGIKKMLISMKKIVLTTLSWFTVIYVIGQDTTDQYRMYIAKADSLLKAKQYRQAAVLFSKAFETNNNLGLVQDRYKAACSWAQSGVMDSAFSQLYRIATKARYSDYDHITTDKELEILHQDSRWFSLLNIVMKNKQQEESKLNVPLKTLLEDVLTRDQKNRKLYFRCLDSLKEENKTILDSINVEISKDDSINLKIVEKVLQENGWVGSDVVGAMASIAIFIVIQHSDLPIQEKYLPMALDAVKKGNLEAKNIALLEDRISLQKNNYQLYGSQVVKDTVTGKWKPAPIKDELNVDKRRAEIGLEPLSIYLKQFGIEY